MTADNNYLQYRQIFCDLGHIFEEIGKKTLIFSAILC